jgi:glucan phosphorylase
LPGKTLIREIVQLSRAPEIAKHIVFVEDYSIEVAREMVQGVDLWLNTPRRGEEACGTSGMKAGMNGVLNLSILDGWFDEGYEISGGWAIGDRESVLRTRTKFTRAPSTPYSKTKLCRCTIRIARAACRWSGCAA